jgi:acetyl-CoA acetyltransferase
MSHALANAIARTALVRVRGGIANPRSDDLSAAAMANLLHRLPDLDRARAGDAFCGCANHAGEGNCNVRRVASFVPGRRHRCQPRR